MTTPGQQIVRCDTGPRGGTLVLVPTTRPRHQVTETPSIGRALDRAAARWPGEPRGKLLVRLVQAGSAALADESREIVRRRRTVIAETSGKYDDVFGSDFLDELRGDWPA